MKFDISHYRHRRHRYLSTIDRSDQSSIFWSRV